MVSGKLFVFIGRRRSPAGENFHILQCQTDRCYYKIKGNLYILLLEISTKIGPSGRAQMLSLLVPRLVLKSALRAGLKYCRF